MADSFSIKVGGDTKEFNKSLRDADNQIRTTTRLGDALTKTLEHKYDAKTAEQAQKQFQKALSDTQEKAEALRAQLKHMEEAGKVDSNQYRKLETDLAKATLEAAQLGKKLEDVDKMSFDNVTKNIEKVGSTIESAGKKLAPFSAMAAGALAGSAKLAKDAVAVGDDLATLADKYDMSTKAIQQWQYVAMQSDVSSDVLYKAAQKVQGAIGDQMTGATNAAVKALDGLGISYKDFDSNEQAFEAVVKALSDIESQAELSSLASDIFGERFGTELIPLFAQGEDAVADYIAEFEQVGYLSEETIDQLADLDNVVNNVTAQFELAKTELGVAMIPVYQALIDILRDHVIPAVQTLAEWFDNLSPAGQNAAIGVLAVVGMLAPLLIILGKVATGVGGLIKLIPSLGKALDLLSANPIIAIIGVVAILLTILYNKNEQFKESIDNLLDTLMTSLSPVLEIISDVLSRVFAALAPVFDILTQLLGSTLSPLIDLLGVFLIPLQLMGEILTALQPAFEKFGEVIEGVFMGILGVAENVINWIIDKINWVIRAINHIGNPLGVEINEVENVDFTSSLEKSKSSNSATAPPTESDSFSLDDISGMSADLIRQSVGGSYTQSAIDNSKTDQSTNTYNIYVDSNEYVSADEIVNIVSKKIATLSSARG